MTALSAPRPPASEEAHARLDAAMAAAEAELIDIHRRIVQVPSVNWGDGSSAREDAVCAVMAEYLGGAGIASRVRESAPGRANLMASLVARGGSGGKRLLLISHSDVVPPGDEKAWRFPPFSAELAEGRIWGRGANDCKMLVAAELFAAAILARVRLPGHGELRLAVGADEEAGGRWGFGWLAENEPEFLRADLCVNEGGGASVGKTAAGAEGFLVGCGEKGRYEVRLTAKGPGTHASVPWGKANPLARLAQAAARLAAWEGAGRPASPIFEGLRARMGLAEATTSENLAATISEAERRGSASFRNSLLAQSRITIVPTMFACGDKSNAVPLRAELRCDARILPGQTRADLDRALAETLAEFPDIQAEIEPTADPSVSPWTPEVAALFEGALRRTFTPEAGAAVEPIPTWCTGFTDSRFIRALGTPAYGFQPVEPRADADRLGIHCVDESIEASMLLPCARALGHLALDFLA